MTGLPVVAFVDDEERILRSLRMLFRGKAEVLATTSGGELVEWTRTRRIHVVVSDQRMPGMTGVHVLREVARHSPSTMRILLTGYADLEAVTASVNEGEVYRFVEKPWNGPNLIATVLDAARVAEREFSVPLATTPVSSSSLASAAVNALVLDSAGTVLKAVQEILPETVNLVSAANIEEALERLTVGDYAVIVAVLASADDDIVDAIKQLKRIRPATLVIAVSPLRDSRLAIGLINEGQIFRFLLAPPGRELMRRSLLSALERHAQLRSAPPLLDRHVVHAPTERSDSLSGRLMHYWRRLRDVGSR